MEYSSFLGDANKTLAVLSFGIVIGASATVFLLWASLPTLLPSFDLSKWTSTRRPDQSMTTARHVAIIMDGNRRYGRAKYKDALKGHWDGGQTLVDCVQWCAEAGVQTLTVYAFSTENWKREQKEVDVLMTIFCKYAEKCEKEAMEKNMRISVLSTEREKLPPSVVASIEQMERNTALNDGFHLNLCVSYGSRSDIARSCQKLSEKVKAGVMDSSDITEESIAQHLSTAGLKDPDILIRTSGEHRLSNYLLYELAYSEFFFLDKFWPQLTKKDLFGVFHEYDQRQRRFGK